MDPIYSERSGVARRNFLQIAASGVGVGGGGGGGPPPPPRRRKSRPMSFVSRRRISERI
jgi:hypothetical protein